MSEKILAKILKDCVHGKVGESVELDETDVKILEKADILSRVVKGVPSAPSPKPQEPVRQSSSSEVKNNPSAVVQPKANPRGESGQEKEKEVFVNPRLAAWLQYRGFRQLGDKPTYTKHDKIGERIVRLCVDFKNNPWGSRLTYALDEGTGEWKDSSELRDAEELLAYKRFRDELKKGNETKLVVKPVASTKATEVAPGIIVAEKDQQIMVVVEERDEKQIMTEMLGEVLKEYVYQISGQKPRLSYAGVKEAARRRGNIHVTKIEIEETKDGSAIIAKSEVYDLQNNFKIWGVAIQKKRMRLRDGCEVEDDFFITKAVSKAIRNGLRACIPEKLVAELISRWLEARTSVEGRRD
ncbi:MAG: hypothetical protein ABH852_02205 [Methanobacteriota archaeon]